MVLHDRLRTPGVTRAMRSPAGIVGGGAGAAVAIVAGLPVAAAAGAGVVLWAARVAWAIPRRAPSARVDPFVLEEPWRGFVRRAMEARARFDRAVSTIDDGPLRRRLDDVGDRIDDSVAECWRIAERTQGVDRALADLDTSGIRRRLDALEADDADPTASSDLARTAEALRAQLASADRVAGLVADAARRLQLLDARLDEAVARAVELSVGPTTGSLAGATVDGVGADVDAVVSGLEALRLALAEIDWPGRIERPGPSTGADPA